jgi:hypothetical protein
MATPPTSAEPAAAALTTSSNVVPHKTRSLADFLKGRRKDKPAKSEAVAMPPSPRKNSGAGSTDKISAPSSPLQTGGASPNPESGSVPLASTRAKKRFGHGGRKASSPAVGGVGAAAAGGARVEELVSQRCVVALT